MSLNSSVRDRVSLKFWEAKGLLTQIGGIADTFYDFLVEWMKKVDKTIDPDTAPIELVEILGWGRDVERFLGEDDELLRKRVRFALQNARDAGSKIGFEQIWQRLGLGDITQTERFDNFNWDVIRLRIDETIFAKYAYLLETLIRAYGRTCRRYEFESIADGKLGIRPFNFDVNIYYTKCKTGL